MLEATSAGYPNSRQQPAPHRTCTQGARHGNDTDSPPSAMTDATVVLRARRWLDVGAGEVRSPAVVVVTGDRITSVNPPQVPSGPEIDLGHLTILPGLMDMEV